MTSERRLAAIMAGDMSGYSRLMEADEDGVIARQKSHRRELIDPSIERHRGRIIKTTGDGLLVEFASAQDSVNCAIEIQQGMAAREAEIAEDSRISYRIGINVGDMVFDSGDVFGDGVNVAARLEALAEPGGVCLSETVHQMLGSRFGHAFRDLGSQRVKNISRPIGVWQWSPDPPEREPEAEEEALNQRVQFCMTDDGVQLAYASVGEGTPVFKAPNWLNHLEYEWRSPVWGPMLSAIAAKHRLVRFDQRGNGLSDWEVEEISYGRMIADMARVVEASGLEQFALLGISQGCGLSVRFAAEYPEKVKCLVLYGGYLRGPLTRGSKENQELHDASVAMIRHGWGSPNATYRHFFTEVFMPDATPEQMESFDELQRICITPENAVRIQDMIARTDVAAYAARIQAPTLVLHARGDQRAPFEEGRRMAALIPNARFVTLEGNNHALLEGSPAFNEFFKEFNAFLEENG